MKKTFIVVTAALWCYSISLSMAVASPGFDEAVKLFNARQYSPALAKFTELARANPNDGLCHYYMGLCYQSTNQMTQAKSQYEWVAAATKDAGLKAKCQQALSQLQRYQSQRITGSSVIASSSSSGPGAQAGRSTTKVSGRLKVIEFYTDWCGQCKKLTPAWEKISSDFRGKADFQTLNAETDGQEEAKKFAVTGYPTIIFTDSSGKELKRVIGPNPSSIVAGLREFAG